jgi:hypothetical protein
LSATLCHSCGLFRVAAIAPVDQESLYYRPKKKLQLVATGIGAKRQACDLRKPVIRQQFKASRGT